jgi:hypothetical protein
MDMSTGGDPLKVESVSKRAAACSGAPGAASRCEAYDVVCEGLPAAVVEVAYYNRTAGTSDKGSIVFGSGGDGTGFYNYTQTKRLLDAGYNVIDRRWPAGWFTAGTAGPQQTACRLAALLRYLRASVAPTGAFCATGNSGASAWRLLVELALHELDVVLTDAPLPPSVRVRAFNHLLGESPVAMFAAPALARQYRARFPRSLSDAPILLPTEQTMLRRGVDSWLSTHDLRPNVVGEFEDSALLKTIAQAGIGVFAAPTLMAEPIRAQYGCELIGHLDGVVERFYAISVERRIKHPAVAEICDAARQKLFAE